MGTKATVPEMDNPSNVVIPPPANGQILLSVVVCAPVEVEAVFAVRKDDNRWDGPRFGEPGRRVAASHAARDGRTDHAAGCIDKDRRMEAEEVGSWTERRKDLVALDEVGASPVPDGSRPLTFLPSICDGLRPDYWAWCLRHTPLDGGTMPTVRAPSGAGARRP